MAALQMMLCVHPLCVLDHHHIRPRITRNQLEPSAALERPKTGVTDRVVHCTLQCQDHLRIVPWHGVAALHRYTFVRNTVNPEDLVPTTTSPMRYRTVPSRLSNSAAIWSWQRKVSNCFPDCDKTPAAAPCMRIIRAIY